jgi:hypothetical protein
MSAIDNVMQVTFQKIAPNYIQPQQDCVYLGGWEVFAMKKIIGVTLVVIGVIATPIPIIPGFLFWIPGAFLLYKERKARECKNESQD